MEKLIEGLRYFRTNVLWQKRELFAECLWGQRPFAMLIACSDSRPLPETLLQLAPGDLFVSRNAGNIVPAPEEAGGSERAAIEYAVTALGVTDLIVCGHYRCGAIEALFREPDGSLPAMEGWLRHAAETKAILERDHTSLTGEARWDKGVEVNVLVQLKHLARHPAVASRLATGNVRLHGWTVRLETGQIYTESPEHGRFVPLLEVPAIRGASPEPGGCRESLAPRARPSTERKHQSNVGYLATSALSLLALASLQGLPDGAPNRVQGGPPGCACLAPNDNAVVPCPGSCPLASVGEIPVSRIARDGRALAWR